MIRKKDLDLLYEKAHLRLKNKFESLVKIIPNSYVIKLTTDCNLRCKYCYMGKAAYKYDNMSNETFIKILNQIKTMCYKFTIYLHGGEPCRRLDLIRELKSWIEQEQLEDRITIMLQTNGTFLNEELIDIIKSLNINVGVSIDGIDSFANQARVFDGEKESVQLVIKNVKRLLANNIDVGIFSVLSIYNVDNIVKLIQYFNELGIKGFVINPLVLWGNAQKMRNAMATQEQVYYAYTNLIDWLGEYNALHSESEMVQERNLHWWFKALKEGKKGYMCNCSPCGAGIQTIAISPKGDVYICDQYYGDPNFYIGNMLDLDLQIIMQNAQSRQGLLRNIYNIDNCKSCVWRFVCSGGCSAASYYYNGSMSGAAPYCEAYKMIFTYLSEKLKDNNIVL